MKFEEFKKKDDVKAFDDFISVKEAKALGIIPKEYDEIFNEECQCGSDMIIKTNRKQLMCCDPRCKIKLGYMLAEVFARFEVADLGPKTCKSIIVQTYDRLKYKSHLEPLLMEPEVYPRVLAGSKGIDFVYGVNKIKTSKLTFGSLIARLGLPSLDKTAGDMFDEYPNVDSFVADVSKHKGVINLLESKGIHDLKKAFYIKEFLPELYLAEILMQGNLKDLAVSKIEVCLTGRLSFDGMAITKGAFLEYLNTKSIAKDGKVLYEFSKSTAKETVPYIIYSKKSADDKFLTGLRRQKVEDTAKTGKQILIKPEELYEKVRKVVEIYERELVSESE